MPSLSVILPAYNEERSIESVLAASVEALARLVPDFEILVVDDGSTDGTASVSDQFGRRDPRVRTIRHPTNRGMGAAIRSGMLAARGDLVCDLCADGQFDPRELARFLAAARISPIVIGRRTEYGEGLRRRLTSWVYRALLGFGLGISIRDPAWVKLWPRSRQGELAPCVDGFFWETEFLARARAARIRWVEVASVQHPRLAGKSKGAEFSRVLEATRSCFRLWWQWRIRRERFASGERPVILDNR